MQASLCQSVGRPAVELILRPRDSLATTLALQVPLGSHGNRHIHLVAKSQLVILELRRLEQAAHFHRSLAFLISLLLGCQLALFSKQLGIVAREFLERDEEVAKNELEPRLVLIRGEESVNEAGYLGSAVVRVRSDQRSRRETYG
jgi:hypothetical protein